MRSLEIVELAELKKSRVLGPQFFSLSIIALTEACTAIEVSNELKVIRQAA
jgi:hypothetical protein